MMVSIESNRNYCVYTFKKKSSSFSIADKKFSLFNFIFYYIKSLIYK